MARQSFESAAFDGDDKPIDPTFLRVQARLRRLMLIGGLTLGLGLVAVFAAILYKITTYDTTGKAVAPDAAVPSLSLAAMGLPPGSRLVSTALDGNRLSLTYDTGQASEVVVVDLKAGVVVSRLKIGP
jgi:hypothetical protein